MATRYAYKSLCSDIAAINVKLEQVGSDRYLEVGKRNGYTAIDVLSQDQYNYRKGLFKGHSGCLRMLVGGSPKECFHAAETFYYQHLLEIERRKAS